MHDTPTFAYTFGIEEEFFLTHARSRQLAATVPRSVVNLCVRRYGEAVAPELLRSQIELVSPVFHHPDQARGKLGALRRGVAEIAGEQDLRLTAAGTHPLAAWREQVETPNPRYRALMDDFRIVGRRNVLCGLHIHVAVPPGVDRVVLMNRLLPYLPAFLALSTSSPYWHRADTGLLSYRQSAYDEWPRTGIPDHFRDEAEYDALVQRLVRAGAIRDAGYLWWVIRPALRYPTLELRICDACTRLDDTLALAALYRCLVRSLARHLAGGAPEAEPWTPFTRRLIDENRWRAKRFGLDADFIVRDGADTTPCRTFVAAMLDDLADDARHFGCEAEFAQVRTILDGGTSAHRQRQVHADALARGESRARALQQVVDWLTDATLGRDDGAAASAHAGSAPQARFLPTPSTTGVVP